jgi:hypothetical protein
MRRKRRRQSNKERIAQRWARIDYGLRGQSFGATTPAITIDPSTATVNIPVEAKPVIMPWWIELPLDAAFWRVWTANSMQMRADGYRVFKIDGKWRAFLAKTAKWHKARGRAG